MKLKNDMRRFHRFFEREGVAHHWTDRRSSRAKHGDEPQESRFWITVAQAHYCFDKDMMFIGTLWYDMGCFDKKVEPNDRAGKPLGEQP